MQIAFTQEIINNTWAKIFLVPVSNSTNQFGIKIM